MTLRWLAREFREFPATSSLCMSWIIVFIAMTYLQLASGSPLTLSQWLVFGFGGGERFGDLTLNDLARFQIWRLLTCNFIHYSLLHIALNALALYQIGSIVESWYGSHQLIFIYGLTGAGGNFLSAMARIWARTNPAVHSAGGSVVIMGLVGLCAVAGWRSRTADGKWLSKMMVIFIVLTAALGIVFPHFIDNWGHAGGLVVGATIGLAHRRLLASVNKPSAWGAGVLMGLLIAGSAAAQFVFDRRESPGRMERSLLQRLDYLVRASGEMSHLRRPLDLPGRTAAASRSLDDLDRLHDVHARVEVEGLRRLIPVALKRPLTEKEYVDLDRSLVQVLNAIRREGLADLMPRTTAVLDDLKQELDEYGHLVTALRWIDALDRLVDAPARAELQGLRPLVADAMEHPIAADRRRELDERLTRTLAAIRRNYVEGQGRLRQLRSTK